MGSKEEDVPKEPIEKTVFVEDMNDSELATAVGTIKYCITVENLQYPYICSWISLQD